MPEDIGGRKVFSLFEVAASIQRTLEGRYKQSFWVRAEMNKLNHYKHSGHCYPELVERVDGKIVAQFRSVLWGTDYQRIDDLFRKVLNEPLKDGIKVLMEASIRFHPEYGLSLTILDIDPQYTLGDLEREKQETLRRLKAEALYHANKRLTFPRLPQRIAIISVETSKGYADFTKVLEAARRSWGYRFFHFLFPSLLQGDDAVKSIVGQLRRIRQVMHHFDVVAIVRGGGGDIGLACYNQYELAREIAEFPLPVLSGIGHATNETVVEMIAHLNAITPTKLAEELIQRFHNFSVPVREAQDKLGPLVNAMLTEEKISFQSEIKLFRSVVGKHLLARGASLQHCARSLVHKCRMGMQQERQQLDVNRQGLRVASQMLFSLRRQVLSRHAEGLRKDAGSRLRQEALHQQGLERRLTLVAKASFRNQQKELMAAEKLVQSMHPENVLRRGYSITLLDGRALTSDQKVRTGDMVETMLYQGRIVSRVSTTSTKNQE
ncbi:MAG: exodeoxyribonuclease VII large subunit [Saprospiraceae bacterium]|nr:exodeoxyribonuclease VII large subunit [Saprospiraceae bacterium]